MLLKIYNNKDCERHQRAPTIKPFFKKFHKDNSSERMSVAKKIVDLLPPLTIDDEVKYGNLRAVLGKFIFVDFNKKKLK